MKFLSLRFRIVLLLVLGSLAAMSGLQAGDGAVGAKPSTDHDQLVILVRHAEKALDQGNDPGLTEAGQARAQALIATLREAGVGAIVTTEWQRTRLTAAPLADALGITAMVVATAGADGAEHPQKVAAMVRSQKADVVLVVGHSNTLPQIIQALGAPATGDIADGDYGNLFLLWRRDGKISLVKSRY
jgi:phosphohistidine phosphatase SixA